MTMTVHDHTGTPSDALIELMAPDGYYKYLNIPKPSSNDVPGTTTPASDNNDGSSRPPEHNPLMDDGTTGTGGAIDEDLVKRNYRKLSRKHHPDRPGGDADTFRLLNRAQRVLLNPKLRHQYDILGVDLDDDEEEMDAHHHHDDSDNNQDGDGKGEASSSGDPREERPSTAQGIIQEIASMALSSIMQLTVRTAMMAGVAIILVRYRLLLYPAIAFLSFIAFRIFQQTHTQVPVGVFPLDFLSPLIIAIGLLSMHNGRTTVVDTSAAEGSDNQTITSHWSYLFWFGEATVIGAFTYNTAIPALPRTPVVLGAITVFAVVASLCLRGYAWNYAIVIGMEVFLGIVVALAFPIVEFILEAILNDKLKKVGDKVRAHHEVLDQYYKAKIEQMKHGEKK